MGPAIGVRRRARPRDAGGKINPGYSKLRREIVHSIEIRPFFENVLWPRLRALTDAPLGDEDLPLPRTLRRAAGRGPSREALAALIDQIEDRTKK